MNSPDAKCTPLARICGRSTWYAQASRCCPHAQGFIRAAGPQKPEPPQCGRRVLLGQAGEGHGTSQSPPVCPALAAQSWCPSLCLSANGFGKPKAQRPCRVGWSGCVHSPCYLILQLFKTLGRHLLKCCTVFL